MKKRTLKLDEIFAKKPTSVLSRIKTQHQQTLLLQQHLLRFDIPYFHYTKVCFFDGKKLILKTEIPELLSKFRELKKDLIRLLNTDEAFADLVNLELVLAFETKTTSHSPAHKSNRLSTTSINHFNRLAAQVDNQPIKSALLKITNKHHP